MQNCTFALDSKKRTMIQRIQSIYLLLAGVLVGLATVFPLVDFTLSESFAEGVIGRLSAFAWKYGSNNDWQTVYNIYSLGIAVIIAAIANIGTIFVFNKRKLQIKITHYTFILKIAISAVIVYFICILQGDDVLSTRPQIGSLLIVISMVFDWLAVKAIRKDEALVRSIDRIR